MIRQCLLPIFFAAVLASSAVAFETGNEFRDCDMCPILVVIPAGSFMRGSLESETGRSVNEGPRHHVTIQSPFAIGKFEVTFEQWDACVEAGGCTGHRPDDNGLGRGKRAVFDVSWLHAKAYVEWLTQVTGERYRLLSEAEWEYAARAGTTAARFWGPSADQGCGYANAADLTTRDAFPELQTSNCRDGSIFAETVGSFAANGFALHDMLGNVFESVEDCLHDSYDGAPQDGTPWTTGDCSKRVLRGGSWGSKPTSVRSAYRGSGLEDSKSFVAGFRVARDVK